MEEVTFNQSLNMVSLHAALAPFIIAVFILCSFNLMFLILMKLLSLAMSNLSSAVFLFVDITRLVSDYIYPVKQVSESRGL